MQNIITIQHGVSAHLAACVEAVKDSLLGQNYFSEQGRIDGLIKDGLLKGEISIASTLDRPCAGFIWYTGNGMFYRFPYVRLLAVHSDCRSTGIGTALLDYVENLMGRRGHEKIFLTVAEFNGQAKALYERLGYRQVGLIPDLFVKGYPEHVMMKRL